eukprot:m.212326 g.212326  ORF g.212326 m.212326 type:complete len:72 (-) comp26076_c0_seq1:326-541(-)
MILVSGKTPKTRAKKRALQQGCTQGPPHRHHHQVSHRTRSEDAKEHNDKDTESHDSYGTNYWITDTYMIDL